MGATSTTASESNDGRRQEKAARGKAAAGSISSDGRGVGSGNKSRCKAPRAADRPASDRPQSAGRGSAAPIVELTIDLDDDRVLDAVAQLLLDLVDHEPEAKP